MLRFFLLVLSLFLVSCATTTYEQKTVKTVQDYVTNYGVYLSLWYLPGELKYWTEKDLENFEMGLESGELNGGYWQGTKGDSFLDKDKGKLVFYNNWAVAAFQQDFNRDWSPCVNYLTGQNFERFGAIPSEFCQPIKKRELNYINNLIDEANISLKERKEQEQRKIEQRKEQEQRKIAQQIKEQELQFSNYIAPYKAQCKAFGYTDENLVAKCVQDYVFADFAAQQMANNLEQLREREDQIRLNNAIAAMGEGLTELGKGGSVKLVDPLANSQTQICDFKAFSGAIIKGDCKNLTISSGGVTYWRE